MFGAFGRALSNSAVTFVSKAAAGRDFGIAKTVLAVENTRGGISKASMIRNSATLPHRGRSGDLRGARRWRAPDL